MLSFLVVYLARATLTHICSATVATLFPIAAEESRTMLAQPCAWETLNRSVEDETRLVCMRPTRRMSLFLKRWEYKHMRIEIADRQRRDHEVNGREMRCRTGNEEAVHMQSGLERRRRLHSRERKHSRFRGRTSNL